MKSMNKQEQIAETAVLGCVRNPKAHTAEECAKCDFKHGMCDAYRHVEALYNAVYGKLPEDSVVLSREELSKRDYGFRQIGYDECLRDNPKKDKYIKKLKHKIDLLNAKLDQASKETAQEIMKMLKDGVRYGWTGSLDVTYKEIAERYGVEIKEN